MIKAICSLDYLRGDKETKEHKNNKIKKSSYFYKKYKSILEGLE